MNKAEKLRFLLDEGVPDSVGRTLKKAGHEVILLRESGVARGSPDQLVCTFAQLENAILVALDGDMKQIAKGKGVGGSRFKSLNLLKLSCPECNAANRVDYAMSLIEHEWRVDKLSDQRRLFMEIGISMIKTNR